MDLLCPPVNVTVFARLHTLTPEKYLAMCEILTQPITNFILQKLQFEKDRRVEEKAKRAEEIERHEWERKR